MSGFPQRANINVDIAKTILERAGNNELVSKKLPWIRVTSCLNEFLSLDSTPLTDSFNQRYGSGGKSGRIGIDKNGDSVYANDIRDSTNTKQNSDDYTNIGTDRSLRSSPVIESVAVTQGNEGLSKKVNFTIKAFTVGQSEALIQYFLEPGTNVLVEWGFNEKDSVIQKSVIEACAIAEYNNHKIIADKRKDSKGTYDALLGIVTGGAMAFGDGESYNIEVELTSIGEIPAYLQHHRNVRTENGSLNPNNSALEFKISDIDDDADAEGGSSIGLALFKQMFNDLPAHKRIKTIKDLQLEEWATHESNFVNIDNEIREDIIEATKDGDLNSKSEDEGGEEITIPTDTPLFDKDRYIRLSLAFTILDLTHSKNLKPNRQGTCKAVETQNPYINWRTTICKAHKNIFSNDGSILMIPNKYTPKFGLKDALSSNPKPTVPIKFEEGSSTNIITSDVRPNELPTDYEFPRSYAIEYQGQKVIDSDYECISFKAFEWGYVKDLFINFDFFIECISSPGLLTKDVYFKILNGISSAVNMYWDFQIVEQGYINPETKLEETNDGQYVGDWNDKCIQWWKKNIEDECTNGANELKLVDFNTTGNTTNKLGKVKFQSRGLNSPFLSAELNFDIPASMKGQMIGQKNSTNSDPNPEQTKKDFRGLFTSYKDAVNTILNPLRDKENKENEAEDEAAAADAAERKKDLDGDGKISTREQRRANYEETVRLNQKETESKKQIEEQKKANYENFSRLATVVPKPQDRNSNLDVRKHWKLFNRKSNDVNIEDLMMVVAWNDVNVLKNVEDINTKNQKGFITKDARENNSIPLPIKFNFTIHGVSGLRVGDTFNIKDLPGIYKKKVFTVTQVTHDIEQAIWKTSVQSMLIMIDAFQEDNQ